MHPSLRMSRKTVPWARLQTGKMASLHLERQNMSDDDLGKLLQSQIYRFPESSDGSSESVLLSQVVELHLEGNALTDDALVSLVCVVRFCLRSMTIS